MRDLSLQKNTRGFSMIELLVAIGLFGIIVSIAVGAFVNALKTQRQAVGFLSATSNISLVIEQMAREIRTGTDFCINGHVCGNQSELAFVNAQGVAVKYCLLNGAVVRTTEDAECANGNKITAENISVRYLNFALLGNEPGDGFPPRITIMIGVSPNEASISGNVLHLQTTVSARTIDS